MKLVKLHLLFNCIFYTLYTAHQRIPPDYYSDSMGWRVLSLNPSETSSLSFSYGIEEIDPQKTQQEYRDQDQSYFHLPQYDGWVDLELLHQEEKKEKSQHDDTLPNFFDGTALERSPQAPPTTQMINHLLEKAKTHYNSIPKQEDVSAPLPTHIHEDDVEKFSPLNQLRWYGLQIAQMQQRFIDQDGVKKQVAIFSAGSDSDVIKAAAQLTIKHY